MSSSVLGLGAAALGAANLGARSLGSKPGKMVRVSQPSHEDYMQGYSSMMSGPNKKLYSEKERVKALFGGAPIIGGTGEFYYGGMPKKIPQGYTLMRGPDIGIPGPTIKGRSYGSTKETYRLVQLPTAAQQEQPQGQLKLDLTQGGKKNVLNRADIKYAKEQGATRSDIRQAVEAQNMPMSKAAEARLYQGLDLAQGGKNNVLNVADIKHAKQQGVTRSEIRQAVESQDIRMSAKAKARLYKEKKAQA